MLKMTVMPIFPTFKLNKHLIKAIVLYSGFFLSDSKFDYNIYRSVNDNWSFIKSDQVFF